MTTQLHNRLTNQANHIANSIKSKNAAKDAFNTAEAATKSKQPGKLEHVLGSKGAGENTLNEIQAIIVS